MQVIQGYLKADRAFAHPVVTIGNFDGVHSGHREIIRRASEIAKKKGGTLIAYTFRPHPQQVLRPDARIELLTTYDEKLELLGRAGVDVVIEEPFSRDFSTLTAERFFSEVLLHRLNAEAIVVGYDFGFGRGRSGQLDQLGELCRRAGVDLEIIQPQRSDSEVVSSSKIREALRRGDVAVASRLLGYEFFYRGNVIRGDQRGRQLGFPTANLLPGGKIVVSHGVYATRTCLRSSGELLPSVTNIGRRPTFHPGEVLIETHVLTDRKLDDLYGAPIEVRLVDRLREEKRFSGPQELSAQIAKDIEEAKKRLAAIK